MVAAGTRGRNGRQEEEGTRVFKCMLAGKGRGNKSPHSSSIICRLSYEGIITRVSEFWTPDYIRLRTEPPLFYSGLQWKERSFHIIYVRMINGDRSCHPGFICSPRNSSHKLSSLNIEKYFLSVMRKAIKTIYLNVDSSWFKEIMQMSSN